MNVRSQYLVISIAVLSFVLGIIFARGDKIIVFQSVWGVHTSDIFDDHGRAVIGKAAITYVGVGAHVSHSMGPMLRKVITLTQVGVK